MAAKHTLPLFIVDSFSDVAFRGNPAAVVPLLDDKDIPDAVLQNIASEMNLSETAFIKILTDGDNFKRGERFGLRWFTPTVEVKLCGHATLASAAALFYKLGNSHDTITFVTLSGELHVVRSDGYLCMDLPLGATVTKDKASFTDLIEGFKEYKALISDVEYCPSLRYLLVRLQDGIQMQAFENWMPDLEAIEKGGRSKGDNHEDLVALIVTVQGNKDLGYVDKRNEELDFVSRCFAPWAGIPEDPVTGSAHTVLACYWGKQTGRTTFKARQCSRRGGDVLIHLKEDRVELRGEATLVLEGQVHF